jgi:hypothetical protein
MFPELSFRIHSWPSAERKDHKTNYCNFYSATKRENTVHHNRHKHFEIQLTDIVVYCSFLLLCVFEISTRTSHRLYATFSIKIHTSKVLTPMASQSASGPYQSSDRHLSAKLVTTFADRGCQVVSAANPRGRNFDFLDRSRYYFFQVAPQLPSRGWVNPVPDPLLLKKSSRAGNRTRDPCICGQKL